MSGEELVPDLFRITVRGLPVAQGSVKAFVVKGKARVVSVSRELRAWRDTIADVARVPLAGRPLEGGPIGLRMDFRLPKPKKPKNAFFPVVYPDLDKLQRGVLDALSEVFYEDDSQVVEIQAFKHFGPPGVTIEAWRVVSLEEIAKGE